MILRLAYRSPLVQRSTRGPLTVVTLPMIVPIAARTLTFGEQTLAPTDDQHLAASVIQLDNCPGQVDGPDEVVGAVLTLDNNDPPAVADGLAATVVALETSTAPTSTDTLNLTAGQDTSAAPTDAAQLLEFAVAGDASVVPSTDDLATLAVDTPEDVAAPTETTQVAALTIAGDTGNTPTAIDTLALVAITTETAGAPTDAAQTLNLTAGQDTSAAPTETTHTLNLTAGQDTSVAPTETSLSAGITPTGESSPAPAETSTTALTNTALETNALPTTVRSAVVAAYATTGNDNDGSKTSPSNSAGVPNGVFAVVSTNLSAGDVTNPVKCNGHTFAFPPAFTTATLKLWFKIPAGAGADTVRFQYTLGGSGLGTVIVYQHGVAAVDYTVVPLAIDVTTNFAANIGATITVICEYKSAVVASPVTAVSVDAWAIEYTGALP